MQANAAPKRAATVWRLCGTFAVLTIGAALCGLVASAAYQPTAAANPSQSARPVAMFASAASDARQPTPFGFLEFDWDANAPNGVPGFDAWPQGAPKTVRAQSVATNQFGRMIRAPEELLPDIAAWLTTNFELPAIQVPPSIELVSRAELASRRFAGHPTIYGVDASEARLRQQALAVAIYDHANRTIFLTDNWTGSPADQSVLVHEMVHHLQNAGGLKFECPMAREKMAYSAQNRWLMRFGTNLQNEFDVDAFTVLVSSACMH